MPRAAGFDPRFTTVFPRNTGEEERLFDLLRRAYVDARYSKSYRISEAELKAIGERVEALKVTTTEVCGNKIGELLVFAQSKGKS